jgi:hypothetical protein
MNWIKTGNEYRPSGLIRVNKCYLTRADLRRPPLYPSEIRVHVDAYLTGCSCEPRLDIGYPEGADQGKKFGRPSALDAGKKRKIADRYAAGETMAELAREYEVGEATIFRALRLEPIAEGEIEGPAREAALSIQVMTFVTGACQSRGAARLRLFLARLIDSCSTKRSTARKIPIFANSIGPRSSAASISICTASRHSGVSRSCFESILM